MNDNIDVRKEDSNPGYEYEDVRERWFAARPGWEMYSDQNFKGSRKGKISFFIFIFMSKEGRFAKKK